MRQIEDRWRVNVRDIPNSYEMYNNLLKKYIYNESQINDIRSYSIRSLRNFVNGKCNTYCLKSSNVAYKSCVENCSLKLLESDKILQSEFSKFESRAEKEGDKLFLN
jgi:hypothetical protein